MKIQFLLLILLISVNSCQYKSEEQEEQIDCVETVSYANTVKPIIENNCLGCHNGGQPPNLNAFTLVKDNADKVKEEVISRRMPQSGALTVDEIEAIKCWVDNGSLNN